MGLHTDIGVYRHVTIAIMYIYILIIIIITDAHIWQLAVRYTALFATSINWPFLLTYDTHNLLTKRPNGIMTKSSRSSFIDNLR